MLLPEKMCKKGTWWILSGPHSTTYVWNFMEMLLFHFFCLPLPAQLRSLRRKGGGRNIMWHDSQGRKIMLKNGYPFLKPHPHLPTSNLEWNNNSQLKHEKWLFNICTKWWTTLHLSLGTLNFLSKWVTTTTKMYIHIYILSFFRTCWNIWKWFPT